MTDLALIAGRGRLPVLIAEAAKVVTCVPHGVEAAVPGTHVPFRLETAASTLEALRERGVTRLCLAGGIDRPILDPSLVEPASAPLIESLARVMTEGDGTALGVLLAWLEGQGFEIVAPQEIRPDLMPEPGVLSGTVGRRDEADAARAAEILRGTGTLDIGQGCVVAQGLCLAVEAHPGTDHMLAALRGDLNGRRPDPAKGRGLVLKAPKPGQDRRVDLPTIGVTTVEGAAAAGLGGIVFAAEGVLVPDLPEVVACAERLGLFLWCRP